MNIEKLQIRIIQLEEEVAECKAAIKDVVHYAEDKPWKKRWLIRYHSLLPGNKFEPFSSPPNGSYKGRPAK